MKAEETVRREIARLEAVARADGFSESQATAAIHMQMALNWVLKEVSRPPSKYFQEKPKHEPNQ